MKCEKCGYDDNGTGDTAHFCKRGGVTLKDLIGEIESTPEGKADLDDARKVVAMAAELNRLRTRVAELEAGGDVVKDAERYRWLRHGDNDELVMIWMDKNNKEAFLPRNERLDAAIDAAMEGGAA